MKWIRGYFLICMFLCAGFFHKVKASEGFLHHLANADSLMAAGDYFMAAITYEEVLFFSDDSKTRIHANLGRADALARQGEYQRAFNDLQRSAHIRTFPDLHFEVLYQLAFYHYMAGNYSQTISRLKQISHFYPHTANIPEMLLLFTLAFLMNENPEEAKEYAVLLTANFEISTDENLELLAEINSLFSPESVPRIRSEIRAANYSTFIPGAGHIYAGYPLRGLINATSQALSLGLAELMGYNGLYASGFVVGLGMFQSFYFGGIRQATFLARQRNLIQMNAYKEERRDFIMGLYENNLTGDR